LSVSEKDRLGGRTQTTVQADLNGDGFADRITKICSEGQPEECIATQVEMGLADGSFIEVYSGEDATDVSEKETVFYSPQYFLDAAEGPQRASKLALPGRAMGVPVEIFTEPLDANALKRKCLKLFSDQMIKQCVEEAERDPDGHAFQPQLKDGDLSDGAIRMERYDSLAAIGMSSLVDDEDLTETASPAHAYGRPAMAVTMHELYAPFSVNPHDASEHRLKLRANVIADVKAKTSEVMGEYFYAHALGEIDDRELAHAARRLWGTYRLQDCTLPIHRLMPAIDLHYMLKGKALVDPAILNGKVGELYELVKSWGERDVTKDAHIRIVTAVADRIAKEPQALDRAERLMDAIREKAGSYPGLKELILERIMTIDASGEVSVGALRPNMGELLADTIKAHPEVLMSIPELGAELAVALKDTESAQAFPDAARALWEMEQQLGRSGVAGEYASFVRKIEFLRRMAGIDPVAQIDKLATSDDAFAKRVLSSWLKVDSESLEDPKIIRRLLDGLARDPIMNLTKNNPLNNKDDTPVSPDWIRSYVDERQKNWLRVRLLSKLYSHADPYSFVLWTIEIKDLQSMSHSDGKVQPLFDGMTYMTIMKTLDELLADPDRAKGLIPFLTKLALEPGDMTERCNGIKGYQERAVCQDLMDACNAKPTRSFAFTLKGEDGDEVIEAMGAESCQSAALRIAEGGLEITRIDAPYGSFEPTDEMKASEAARKAAYKRSGGRPPRGPAKDYDRTFDSYIPLIATIVFNARAPHDIPDIEPIVQLAERYPKAWTVALLAIAKKGEKNPKAVAFVRKTIARGHLSDEQHYAAVQASLLLDEEEKMAYLGRLSKHEDPQVRLAAYRGMMTDYDEALLHAKPDELMGPPRPDEHRASSPYVDTKMPSIELIRLVKKGMGDDDLSVKRLAMSALARWRVPDVARLLAADLRRYHEIIKEVAQPTVQAATEDVRAAEERRMRLGMLMEDIVNDPGTFLANVPTMLHGPIGSGAFTEEGSLAEELAGSDRRHVEMMETPFLAEGEEPEEGKTYPNMKTAALDAIAMFGQPADMAPVLEEMLFIEVNADAIVHTAQALLTLQPEKGLHRILDRLEAGKAPLKLVELASNAAVTLKRRGLDIRSYTPRLVDYLDADRPDARELVAKTLNALEDKRVLPYLIKTSHNENPHVRLRMAEALPHFDCAQSAARTVELTKDADVMVRNAALAAMRMYRTEGALAVIEEYARAEKEGTSDRAG